MKKLGLICALLAICGSLTACAKKINGQKAYQVDVVSYSKVNGHRSELIKIKAKTSAPDGYEVAAVKANGKNSLVCRNKGMKNYAQVKHGRLTAYIDPLEYGPKVKKGSKLRYHLAAVKDVKKLNRKDNKAIKEKFDASSIKLKFDPVNEFVQSNVQASLGKGALVSKKSKTVFAITPKKDSDFENEVSKAMYGDKGEWSTITNKVNKLSKQLKTPAGRIALVLINPENHKKFLLVSIGGKAKVDSIANGTVNSDSNSTANVKSSSASASGDSDDDFDLGLILGYLLAYDEDYGDDAEDDSSNYSDNSSNYNDDDSYDNYDDYSNDNSNSESNNQNANDSSQTTGNTAGDPAFDQ